MRDNSFSRKKNVNKRLIEDMILRVNLTGLTIRKEGIQGANAVSSACRLSNWVDIVSITKMDRLAEKCQVSGVHVDQ